MISALSASTAAYFLGNLAFFPRLSIRASIAPATAVVHGLGIIQQQMTTCRQCHYHRDRSIH